MAALVITPELETMARQLAEATGTTPTEAVVGVLRKQVASMPVFRQPETPEEREARRTEIFEIVQWFHSLPWDKTKSVDDLVGYDEFGLPV